MFLLVSTDGFSPPHRRWSGNPRTLYLYEVDINCVSIICNSHILRWGSRDQRTRAGTGLLIINTLVPMVGVEPTRCFHQRILSPSRLPIPSHRQIPPQAMLSWRRALFCNMWPAQITRGISIPSPTQNFSSDAAIQSRPIDDGMWYRQETAGEVRQAKPYGPTVSHITGTPYLFKGSRSSTYYAAHAYGVESSVLPQSTHIFLLRYLLVTVWIR